MSRRPFPALSDEELIRHARQGDREAFDELVRRFRGAMIAIAQQATGSAELAEDVVQDAFLQAFHALPQLRDPDRFFGWLGVITRSRARRLGARAYRCVPTEAEALERLLHAARDAESPGTGEEFARASEKIAVRAALAELPPEHETVLRLYYFEQWSVRQIAAHLSLPIATVKWRLHRGRHLLRERLAQHPVFRPSLSEEIGAPLIRRVSVRCLSRVARPRTLRRRRPLPCRGWPFYRARWSGRRRAAASFREEQQAVVDQCSAG